MAKIESVKDLPEWFDLEKYNGCEGLGALEWYVEITHRKKILSILNSPSKMIQHGAANFAALAAEEVRKKPVGKKPIGHGRGDNYLLIPSDMPIAEVTTNDLWLQSESDKFRQTKGDSGDLLYERWGWIADTECQGEGISTALKFEPLKITEGYPHRTTKPCIMVELSASDALLREAFSAWLKSARAAEKRNYAATRNKPAYDRWRRYGLLPYLDLQIWAIETDTHIPDRVMSAAISHYDAGEANLRKTLAPLASELMQDLSALHALAAIEAARLTNEGPETFDD